MDTLVPEEIRAQDFFGYSVASHKNITAVGAIGRDEMATQSGAIFMYYLLLNEGEEGEETYEYIFDEIVYSEKGSRFDWLGMSVALTDDYLFAGAPGVDSSTAERTGAVYVYQHKSFRDAEDGYIWAEMEKLIVDHGAENDRFGW